MNTEIRSSGGGKGMERNMSIMLDCCLYLEDDAGNLYIHMKVFGRSASTQERLTYWQT